MDLRSCGSCLLCQTTLVEEGLSFCCAGCEAVYRILETQGTLRQAETQSIYLVAKEKGILSNPQLEEEMESVQKNSQKKSRFERLQLDIQEMWCPSCAWLIRMVLSKKKGIGSCLVDYATDLASIAYDPAILSRQEILQEIQEMGYRPIPLEDWTASREGFSLQLRCLVAAFFSFHIMMFAYPIYASAFSEEATSFPALFSWLSLGASLPILLYSARPIWKKFLQSCKAGFLGMEALVVLGSGAAFVVSFFEILRGGVHIYLDSMAVLLFLVLFGKLLESRAKFRTKEALIRVWRSLPQKARKRVGKEERVIRLKEVNVGDILVVFSGEQIPSDGLVVEGEGSCDESLMTGEATPVFKQKANHVLSGTLLLQGWVAIEVTKHPKKSVLSQIVETLERDMHKKESSSSLTERMAFWFVPCILGLGVGSGLWVLFTGGGGQEAGLRFLTVLLIACPCAIGLAAPWSESRLLHALAENGVIVRNRAVLDKLGQEHLFLFDKTGTVTQGKLALVRGEKGLTEKEKSLVKSLAKYSVHPLAQAMDQAFVEPLTHLEKVQEVIGKGMMGWTEGIELVLGSATFFEEKGIAFPREESLQAGETSLFFAKGGVCIAQFILGDRLKPGVQKILQQLQVPAWLISGDRREAVAAVATAMGFSKWIASLDAFAKRKVVDQLQKQMGCVAMVGDGINDASALAKADIAIVMEASSAVSLQVADLVLLEGRLEQLPFARKLATQGRKILVQNIFWAFFYNFFGIGLAMAGELTPLLSAVAMVLSSLMIFLNTERIRIGLPNQDGESFRTNLKSLYPTVQKA